MITCNYKDILVVQGDILEVNFELIGVPYECIKKVTFTCEKLELNVECPYSKFHDAYCLRLASDITQNFPPFIGSYDLTVEFTDECKLTVVNEKLFAVLKKRNKLTREV